MAGKMTDKKLEISSSLVIIQAKSIKKSKHLKKTTKKVKN